MEIPIELEIMADRSHRYRADFVRLLTYLSETGPILFDEQLKPLELRLPQEPLSKMRKLSQRHPDFFSSMEAFEENEHSISASFLAGWNAEECAATLREVLVTLDLEHQIRLKVVE